MIAAGIATFGVIGAYLAYLARYATNGVYWDEWNWVAIFRTASLGHLTFQDLWAQHNEDRMLFPNLIMLVIGHATRFTEIPFIYLGAALLIAAFILLAIGCRDEVRRHPLLYTPCVLVVFSLAQYQNSLWAFQIGWFLTVACICGVLVLLSGPQIRPWQVAAAMTLAVIASYSSLQGLTVWPAGLLVLLRPRVSATLRTSWCAIAFLVTLVYIWNLDFAQLGGPPLSQFLSDLPTAFSGVLVTAGSVAPNLNAPTAAGVDYTATTLLGAMILLGGGLVITSWAAHGRRDRVLGIAAALVVVGILFDLSLMPSRLSAGVVNGTVSRYTTFNLLLLTGVYLGAVRTLYLSVTGGSALRIALSSVGVGFVAAILCIQVPVSFDAGILGGRATRAEHTEAADLTANFAIAPPSLVAAYGYPPSDSYFTSLSGYLSANHLSVFGDGEAASFRATGVLAGGKVDFVLPVPPNLGSIQAQGAAWRAWLALSSVYDQRPDLQAAFPEPSTTASEQLIAWVVASGLPEDDPIYTPVLAPYAADYRMWAQEDSASP
jgi:hypothetical protein